MKKVVFAAIIILFAFVSCTKQSVLELSDPDAIDTTKIDSINKDDTTNNNPPPPPPPPPPTSNLDAMRLLTQKDWKQTSRILNGSETFTLYKQCYKDNIYIFKTSGEYIEDEGPTKCTPTAKQIEKSNWNFLSDSTKFNIGSTEYTIRELTETRLKASFKFGTDVFELTYGH